MKYLIPIALIKILFVFLILQLFCTSCESDSSLYSSDLYREGPLVEILTQLGDFSTDSTNIAHVGDTIYLNITIESDVFFDEITKSQVVIDNGEYLTQFSILNGSGKYVFPNVVVESGQCQYPGNTDYYNARFGNTETKKNTPSIDRPRLRLGFIFNEPGEYIFHYNNPPNIVDSEEDTNIYYGQPSENADDTKRAYAIYLFDLGENTLNYGVWEDDEEYKRSILSQAVYDQAIIEFSLIKK